jgi:hypothetical protein
MAAKIIDEQLAHVPLIVPEERYVRRQNYVQLTKGAVVRFIFV